MMLKPLLLGTVLALSGVLPANAQIARTDLADAPPPAELPPNSFRGRQFVDSTGCVYVRAGQGATSIWVPRVTGDRKALCGFKPTLTRTAASTAPVLPDTASGRIAPVAAPVSAATAPVTVAAPIAAPAAGRYAPPRVDHGLTASPLRGETRQVARVPRPMPVMPASAAPVRTTDAVQTFRGPVLPSVPPVRILPGYRAAWADGRLNPYAGAQTSRGALQTAQVWTQTTPRELKTGPGIYRYIVTDRANYGKAKPYVTGNRTRILVPQTVYPIPAPTRHRIYGTRH